MKKMILALAAVMLIGSAVQAQKINREALVQKIEKNEAAAADEKKAVKAATWINLGKSYIEAATLPTRDLYVGMLEMELQMKLGLPVSNEPITIDNVTLAGANYDYFTAYVMEGQVIGWKETAQVFPGATDKAIEALNKAYEVDPKQAPKIREQLMLISNYCSQLGDASNNIAEYRTATEAFKTAFRAQSSPAFGTPDASRLYYAGYCATAAGANDPASYAEGAELLNKALDLGFVDETGQIYYYLYHSYYGQREADRANVLKAKDALMTGITKFPKNQDILKSLIMLYSLEEGMGDPSELIAMLDEAIAADPQNIELWFSRAQISVALKEYDEAIEALKKTIELNPNSYEAQFFTGYYIIIKADALNTIANEKVYTSMDEADADQKQIMAIYAEAIPYLEAAHELMPQNSDPVQLLKTLCFRLRDEVDGMMEKYQKYDALYKQMA